MGFRLRMPAEIGGWLTELAASEPEAAAEVGAALLALMQAEDLPGPPLVTSPDEPAEPTDPREQLDHAYQRMLIELQGVRQEVAEAATDSKRAELILAEPGLDAALRVQLERQLAAAQELLAALTRRSQLLQAEVDAFRTRKETAKATFTANEARVRIREAFAELGLELDDDEEQATADATAAFDRARAEADRLRASFHAKAGPRQSPAEAAIRELHADPLGSDARLLLAEEPPGTVTVLAVLDDAAAVAEHRDLAVDLAAELLAGIRADGWLADDEASPLEFASATELLAQFYPGTGASVADRAAALVTLTSLADLRDQRGLTAGELAGRASWASLDERSALLIETAGLRWPEVETLAAYVRALGGTLRLTVSLDGEQHLIN